MRVVLDFPQSLIEAFSLVWLPIFVLVLVVREQVLRSQEGSEGNKAEVRPKQPGSGQWQENHADSGAYVSCVPKKKMGYLFGGGFTAPSAMSSI